MDRAPLATFEASRHDDVSLSVLPPVPGGFGALTNDYIVTRKFMYDHSDVVGVIVLGA